MIKFIKKLAIAASLATLSAGQFVVIASNSNNDVDGAESHLKRVVIAEDSAQKTLGRIVKQNKVEIFTHAVNGAPIGNLRLVCREWRNIIDELMQHKEGQKSPYANLPPISQRFVKAAFGGLVHDEFYETFANLRLIYRRKPESEGVVLPFSDLKNPFCGTFNLAECGKAGKYLRFTTSLKDFFEIKGENKYKIVILFAPLSLIAQRVDSTAKPLAAVMGSWTENLGIFCRWGNDKNLERVDYFVHPLSGVVSENSFLNWKKRGRFVVVRIGRRPADLGVCPVRRSFMLDCKPKLGL